MKLSRVRKPRVHIVYEVETEGATVLKELPFVVGVLGDFSGDPTEPNPSLANRKFVQIDRDNFDDVLKKMHPGANFKVKSTLPGENGENAQLSVQLKFNSIEDFEPGQIVEQIPKLKELLDSRNRLRDLLTKVDRSEVLEGIVTGLLEKPSEMNDLSTALEKERKSEGEAEAGDSDGPATTE